MFNRMVRRIAVMGLASIALLFWAIGAKANEGFCGNYRQVSSNAGNCPTCTLLIADNPEIRKYFVEASNGWTAELDWISGDPSRASGRGQWLGTAGGPWLGKPVVVTMMARNSGLDLSMEMIAADGSNLGTVTATYRCTDPGRVQAPSLPPGNAHAAWAYTGFVSEEESEGQGASYNAAISLQTGGMDLSFGISCSPKTRKIGLAMDGREVFGQKARAAIAEGRGRFGSEKSFIDLVIDGQPYPLVAEYYELNGELNLDEGYRPEGRIINGLLRSSVARINSRSLGVDIPLKNSAKSICRALQKCGIRQSYCRSKGF